MSRRHLLAAVLATLASSAGAADFYRPEPSFSWAGFSFGGHIGHIASPLGGNLSSYTGYAAGSFEAAGFRRFDLSPKGLMGGVGVGYNFQAGRFVAGVEADISLLGSNSDGQSSAVHRASLPTLSVTRTETINLKSQASWLATLRARAGYAVLDRMLVYGTGGLAFSQLRTSAAQVAVINTVPLSGGTTTTTQVNSATSDSSTRTGWALGAGVEVAISRSITLRGEYLHYQFGDRIVTLRDQGNPALSTSYKFLNRGDIYRIGVNTLF
ncbi:MAG: outer membrane beta-barrel protein [Proteobacteria bacterium]|nr:outer membrane beta-barrel protein [Pseudomonadota bacterium]